jgi:DNA-binding CsgD family transcriptional regulator
VELVRVVARARFEGAVADIPIPGARLALAEILAGRWAAGAATAGETLRLARATGQEELSAQPLAWLALVAALRGAEAECRALCDETLAITRSHPIELVEDCVRWVAGVCELGAGRAGDALRQLQPITHPVVAGFSALDRIEAAVRAGRPALGLEWLASVEAWASGVGAPWALARAAHGRALLAGGEDADACFARALAHHEGGTRPFERARTALAYGAFLRRDRRRAAAREHLRAALHLFEELGAAAWAAQAEAELRATGETARKRAPSRLDQLTPQEMQVARFVAQGLTTRQVAAQLFLSPRTVDFHLRNIFTKLGISSRTQLTRLALDPGAAAPPGAPR